VPAVQLALLLLAGLALAAALAVAHVRFWAWWYRAPTREDEVLTARTGDGWFLGLGRYRPEGAPRRPPVLLVHGLAMNRQIFDFGVPRYSLARALARAGHDAFTLDVRGHGRSRRGPSRRWNIDDYLREDLPAALDAVRAATGEPDVVYVGHSQGALLGLLAACLYPERIRAVAALAPPVRYERKGRLSKLTAMRRLPVARHFGTLMKALAPFAGFWKPALADVAINPGNVERGVLRRLMVNATEDLQPGVLDQFATFVRDDVLCSADGAVDYRSLLPGARQPALFVSAPLDGLAPPFAVEAGFELWGGPKRYVRAGHRFGHVDLLLGREAPAVFFPVVLSFVREVTSPAGEAAGTPEVLPAAGRRG
jgi:pimeloyl-ACP methyl ester carboxylesterase